MSGFKFDKRKIAREIDAGVKKYTARMTRDYAEMSRRLKGRPLDEIKGHLQDYHRRRGGSISDPELSRIAETIQAGETVTIEVK